VIIPLGAVLSVDMTRIDDDLALAAAAGLTSVRLDVPWARAQPKADFLDGDVVEEVLGVAALARGAGLEPWLRLLQPEIPRWFENDGGFTDARTAGHWWPRWVATAADAFGGAAAGWVPFETPFALAKRLIPADPRTHGELMDTLVVAWRDAWRILRGGPPVMTSLDVAVVRPSDDSVPAEQMAACIDQLRWGLWLDGLREGTVSIPGRADRELADLDGACDIVGIAIRGDAETLLYRTAEQGPEKPLALTYKPLGGTDAERSTAVEAMWRNTTRAAEELSLHSVTITPFVDRPPANDGIVTRERELKDAGRAFVARGA
jgi:hypothetical protein